MEKTIKRKKKKLGLLLGIGILTFVLLVIISLFASKELERRTYKLDYQTLIEKYADQYALDPYLVCAVIHCESGNRPSVRSSAGAVGLMQVMPDTGKWIAEKLGMEDFEENMLENPEINIQMGCWYLNFLDGKFSGNVKHMLAAYNAGHNNVDKWLNDPALSANGQLTEIPFPQTDRYVKKVQNAYEKYKTLYPNAF